MIKVKRIFTENNKYEKFCEKWILLPFMTLEDLMYYLCKQIVMITTLSCWHARLVVYGLCVTGQYKVNLGKSAKEARGPCHITFGL